MIHIMKLKQKPFDKIKNGDKTIESRLFDDKRKKIKVGDIIEFQLKDDDSQIIQTNVIDLYRFQTFNGLISKHGAKEFGWSKKEEVLTELKKFYSDKDEKEFGVLGIKISKI